MIYDYCGKYLYFTLMGDTKTFCLHQKMIEESVFAVSCCRIQIQFSLQQPAAWCGEACSDPFWRLLHTWGGTWHVPTPISQQYVTSCGNCSISIRAIPSRQGWMVDVLIPACMSAMLLCMVLVMVTWTHLDQWPVTTVMDPGPTLTLHQYLRCPTKI